MCKFGFISYVILLFVGFAMSVRANDFTSFFVIMFFGWIIPLIGHACDETND